MNTDVVDTFILKMDPDAALMNFTDFDPGLFMTLDKFILFL